MSADGSSPASVLAAHPVPSITASPRAKSFFMVPWLVAKGMSWTYIKRVNSFERRDREIGSSVAHPDES